MTLAKDTTTKLLLALVALALWTIAARLLFAPQPAVAGPLPGSSGGNIVATVDNGGSPTVFVYSDKKVTVIQNVYQKNKWHWQAIGVVPIK